ncbi:MAG: hypothetical protein R2860_13340 [Desulfobacterales bacterium]
MPHYHKLWEDAKNRQNVFIDLSSPYLDEPLRRAAVNAMGPGRICLYGTDGPFGYPEDRYTTTGRSLRKSTACRFGRRKKTKFSGKILRIWQDFEKGLPNKCISKKSYRARSRSARRGKNLSPSAALRDKKHDGQRNFLLVQAAAKMPS